jgi:hypothetical protein
MRRELPGRFEALPALGVARLRTCALVQEEASS